MTCGLPIYANVRTVARDQELEYPVCQRTDHLAWAYAQVGPKAVRVIIGDNLKSVAARQYATGCVAPA